jgi:DNA-binding response OmpR family regulator
MNDSTRESSRTASPSPDGAIDHGPATLPEGTCVLVVEDDYLIADSLRRLLEMAGARVVGPVPHVDDALALIDEAPSIQVALLDVNLNSEDSYPVARRLRELKIPLIFTSGYGEEHLSRDFAEAPLCMKPCPPEELIRLIAGVMRG